MFLTFLYADRYLGGGATDRIIMFYSLYFV